MQSIFRRSGLMLLFAAAIPLSAHASTIYTATLTGAAEIPPTPSMATGTADLTLTGNTLDVSVSFSGLAAGATASHIHCCAPAGTSAGIAVPFTGFSTGVTSGSYTNTFDLTSTSVYSATFLADNGGTAASAEAALIAGINSGMAYVNIHSTAFPGGEISGYLAAASASSVPEPSTLLLGASMLAGIIVLKKVR